MHCDVTLLRLILLTAQDQDEHGVEACDLVKEVAHWFTPSSVQAHTEMLIDAGLLRDPAHLDDRHPKRLTRVGTVLAKSLHSEMEWRTMIPGQNLPSRHHLRQIAARCTRQLRSHASSVH